MDTTHAPNSTDHPLRALADTTRQRLLALIAVEELSVGEIVHILRIPQSTVSRHLKVLKNAGFTVDRREGTTTHHRARTGNPAGEDLRDVLLVWSSRQPLSRTLRDRLEKVLRQRRAHSGGFFERLGQRWDELRISAFGEAFAGEAIIGLLPSNWTVADIGTGTGYLLPVLADNFRRVIAVEPAAAMLECTRQRVTQLGLKNVDIHGGDLARLPIPDASCDLAIACLVLHHVAEPRQALSEMHRVVRPGGRVLIVEQQAHENQAFYEMMQDHWWGFDAAEFAQQLETAGFVQICHRPLRWTASAKKAGESPGLFALTGTRN